MNVDDRNPISVHKSSEGWKFVALALWLAWAPLLFSSGIALWVIGHESAIHGFTIMEWSVFFIIGVFSMAFALTPTTFLAVVTGYFLSFWGLIGLVASYQLASILGYFLGIKIGKKAVQEFLQRKKMGRKVIENVRKSQFITTILSRISPVLPFAVMNVVLSTSGIRLKSFFWGGLVGMLPRTIFFCWAGIQAQALGEALERKEDVSLIIIVTLCVFLTFYFVLKPSRSKNR